MTSKIDLNVMADEVRAALADLSCVVAVNKVLLVVNERRDDGAAPATLATCGVGVSGWQVTNAAGYGEAATRTFGQNPAPDKLVAAIVETARQRAADLAAKRERWRQESEGRDRAEAARVEACKALGLDPDDPRHHFDVMGCESGKVKLRKRGLDLYCWPDEAPAAQLALDEIIAKLASFGQARGEP